MRLYTASLEKFKIQCNSAVLVFKPRTYTYVPAELVAFVMENPLVKYRGVFLVPDDIMEGSPEWNKRKRAALLDYLGVYLKERIMNYYAEEDDFRRKGVTLIRSPRFTRALRWQEELYKLLDAQSPIEEELSFLDAKRLENTQMPESVKEETSSFEEVKAPESFLELGPKRRGRPRKEVEA